jgi:hypothetical protein
MQAEHGGVVRDCTWRSSGFAAALAVPPKGLQATPAAVPVAFDHSHHQPGHNHSLIVCMKYYAGR